MARPSTEALPRFACPDWWEKIQAGQTPMAAVPVNHARAAKALAFFNRLKLPDVPGTPALSEACGDWFRDILVAFLASEDQSTKQRLVWELLCMVPKKNSKTTYVAALGLTALFMEEAPNRQMLLVAPSQNISERCFDQAQGMIRLDQRLQAIFKVQDHIKRIERRKTGTVFDVKTFDTSIVTGEIPILTIIDELHELGKKAKAAAVMQQIRGGGITMQGGQVLMITTQSDEAPAGIWRTELDKARKLTLTVEVSPRTEQGSLDSVDVSFAFDEAGPSVGIEVRVRTTGRTGVEMEALTACSVAALTIYDMCKSADRSMVIGDLTLWEKTGGRSGSYRRPQDEPDDSLLS